MKSVTNQSNGNLDMSGQYMCLSSYSRHVTYSTRSDLCKSCEQVYGLFYKKRITTTCGIFIVTLLIKDVIAIIVCKRMCCLLNFTNKKVKGSSFQKLKLLNVFLLCTLTVLKYVTNSDNNH